MNFATVIAAIAEGCPGITFKSAETFYWSPSDQTVYYCDDDNSKEALWALLHETGHGVLGHKQYFSDFELVTLEVEAWEKAKELQEDLEIRKQKSENRVSIGTEKVVASEILDSGLWIPAISDDHIQDCLDSYREWLHKRSLCPDCHLSSIQIDERTYTCVFCHKEWKVTAERFCRPYRKSIDKL